MVWQRRHRANDIISAHSSQHFCWTGAPTRGQSHNRRVPLPPPLLRFLPSVFKARTTVQHLLPSKCTYTPQPRKHQSKLSTAHASLRPCGVFHTHTTHTTHTQQQIKAKAKLTSRSTSAACSLESFHSSAFRSRWYPQESCVSRIASVSGSGGGGSGPYNGPVLTEGRAGGGGSCVVGGE